MGFRRRSREYALEVLYQIFFQNQEEHFFLDLLNDYWSVKNLKKFSEQNSKEIQKFTGFLVQGVLRHSQFLDSHVAKHSDKRDMSQIEMIDRSILKIALFEMFYVDNIPCEVSINEAVEVAKKYGSKESHHFVNALLDSVYKTSFQK